MPEEILNRRSVRFVSESHEDDLESGSARLSPESEQEGAPASRLSNPLVPDWFQMPPPLDELLDKAGYGYVVQKKTDEQDTDQKHINSQVLFEQLSQGGQSRNTVKKAALSSPLDQPQHEGLEVNDQVLFEQQPSREGQSMNAIRRVASSNTLDQPCSLSTGSTKGSLALDLYHDCGLESLSVHGQREIYKCSRGEYDEVWYKFKRFETLNLLNLYHYQHQLVELEESIYNKKGVMSSKEIELLRKLMKDYQEALYHFEATSKMKRPPMADREKTAVKMSDILGKSRYEKAPDALGMVDVMPQTLGVEADGIRLFLSKTFHEPRRTQTLFQRVSSGANIFNFNSRSHCYGNGDMGIRTPGGSTQQPKVLFSGRPYAIPISRTVDTLARLAISILAGLFLLIPMISLTYIKKQEMRLLTTCLFVVAFAVMLSISSKASNQELVNATAAYSAVLVVFVGQTA